MVDRGHRELPIRPDYVGKNMPTRHRRTGRRQPRRRRPRATWCPDDALASPDDDGGRRHLLSIADLGAEGIEEILEVSDAFVEVGRRSIPKVPSLRGRTVVTPVRRAVHAHPPVVRDGGQAPVGRRLVVLGGHLVGEEGGVAARHGRDRGGHGRGRLRRPPCLGRRARRGGALGRRRRWSTPATGGTSTPRRPCSTATRSARSWPSGPGAPSRAPASSASWACASPSWATSATAGWRARWCSPSARSGPR